MGEKKEYNLKLLLLFESGVHFEQKIKISPKIFEQCKESVIEKIVLSSLQKGFSSEIKNIIERIKKDLS